jgi:acetyltransferase-like isoleucine patch superfamily enzyme
MLTTKPRFPIKQILLHGWLPSPLKKLYYRLKGYRIGAGVRLAPGSVILGRRVTIGDHVSIGFLSFIRGTAIRLGDHVQIGAATMMDTPNIDIGEGTKINEQVFIGGLQFPDSRLVVGRNCQIMQMTFVNPTRSIVIGDDTGIGGDCLLFGHTSWLSRLEGYPVEFDSIEIGNSVSIAWRVFILPGTQIGDGAVVGANSLVRGKIPPRCLAVGFPARVVRTEPEFPRVVPVAEKEAIVRDIVEDFLICLKGEGLKTSLDEAGLAVLTVERRGWRRRPVRRRLRITTELEVEAPPPDTDVLLSLHRIPDRLRAQLTIQKMMWLDLEAKERPDGGNDLGESLVQHLRRYGIRLFRVKAEKPGQAQKKKPQPKPGLLLL